MKSRSYKKSLGLTELVSLGVGGTIGSGIFVVPGIAAGILGPASLIAWVIVAISASTVLLSLAYIAPRLSEAGGFYSFFSFTFGEKIAAPLISLYLVSSVFGISTIAAGIGQYISYFGPSQVLCLEIGILALFCGINIIGIQISGMTENILTILKILPLVAISFLLVPFIRTENFVQTIPLSLGGLLSTIVIVYWPFTGFEISTIPVEEAKDPSLIKKSLILVMIIVVAIYLILNIGLIGSIGVQVLAASPAPLATAAGLLMTNSGPLVAFVGILAMLSALNAYIIGTSRVLQNMARDHSIFLLKDLSVRGTPTAALFAAGGVSAFLLLLTNHFGDLATISVLATLIPYIFFCVAAWILVPERKARIISMIGISSTSLILVLFFVVS